MNKPKELNWFPSYATHHKIPFGSYVFNEQIERIADSVNLVDRPPFEFLLDNDISGTYLFYNGGINFGDEELNALLDWVNVGNTLMISAVDFEETLLDTLNLETKSVNTVGNFNNEYRIYHLHCDPPFPGNHRRDDSTDRHHAEILRKQGPTKNFRKT